MAKLFSIVAVLFYLDFIYFIVRIILPLIVFILFTYQGMNDPVTLYLC